MCYVPFTVSWMDELDKSRVGGEDATMYPVSGTKRVRSYLANGSVETFDNRLSSHSSTLGQHDTACPIFFKLVDAARRWSYRVTGILTHDELLFRHAFCCVFVLAMTDGVSG